MIKFNVFNLSQERTVVITDKAFYNIKGRDKLKRRIPLQDISAITMSHSTSEFLIHVHSERDYRYLSHEFRTSIVDTIIGILSVFYSQKHTFDVYCPPDSSLKKYMTQSNKNPVQFPSTEFKKTIQLSSYTSFNTFLISQKAEKERITTLLFRESELINEKVTLNDFELLKLLGESFDKLSLAGSSELKSDF